MSEQFRPWWKRGWGIAAIGGGVVVVIVLAFLTYIGTLTSNLREVVPEQVYRSAQLKPDELGALIDRDHIKTVINLRGTAWAGYSGERETCERHGAKLIDVPLKASALPPPERLQELLRAFDSASYPVLFHCQGGADRSGLTGTLYLNVYKNVPLDEAEHRQLTWRYGHFAFDNTRPMNDFFDLYRQTAHGLSLRDWSETVYPSVYAHRQAQGRR